MYVFCCCFFGIYCAAYCATYLWILKKIMRVVDKKTHFTTKVNEWFKWVFCPQVNLKKITFIENSEPFIIHTF